MPSVRISSIEGLHVVDERMNSRGRVLAVCRSNTQLCSQEVASYSLRTTVSGHSELRASLQQESNRDVFCIHSQNRESTALFILLLLGDTSQTQPQPLWENYGLGAIWGRFSFFNPALKPNLKK